jgi:hypothetical protein
MSFRLGRREGTRIKFRSVEMESEVNLPPDDDDEDNESFFPLRQLVVGLAGCGRVQTEKRNYRVFILTNPRIMEISAPSSGVASSSLICFGLLLLLIDGTSEKKKKSFGAMTMNNSIVSVSSIDFVAGQ